MLDRLTRVEAIYKRIKQGNYTAEFYFYLLRELNDNLKELRIENGIAERKEKIAVF